MKCRWCVCIALACAAAATLGSAKPPSPGHPIVGLWHVLGSQCTETWDIRADGTTYNLSGPEESYSEYEVSADPGGGGAYVLTDTITKSNGKPDCTGSITAIGDRATVYMLPISKDRFKMCINQALTLCVAMLIRESKATAQQALERRSLE